MFFFIGLTMATIQGTYARRISPGGEVAAVKRVGASSTVGGRWYPGFCGWAAGLVLKPCDHCRPCCCWCQPSFSLAGGTHCPCWAWGCCSTPLVSGPAGLEGEPHPTPMG